jgi:hypothetical protein
LFALSATPFLMVHVWCRCQAISADLPPKPRSAFFLDECSTMEFLCTYMSCFVCMHDRSV